MKWLFLLIMVIITSPVISQFCNTATSVPITPTASIQYSSVYTSGRIAFTFNAVAGNEYTFSTVGQTTMDTYLRLYSTSTGGSVLTESDDYYNTQSEITWYCSVSGSYSILLTRWTSTSTCAQLNSTGAKIKYQMGSTSGSTIVSIGNGEGVVYQVPVNHYYKYGWSELIYLQSEINFDGNITKIRFQVEPTLPATYVAENQKIYMAHTTYSTFPSVVVKENAQTNYASSNYMLVFSGTITWNIGWVEITLDTPFPWNNTDNLLIKYENREGTFSSNYPMFYYTSKTATVGYYYQDASYPTNDGTRDGFRPNIKLALSDGLALPVNMLYFRGYPYTDGTNNLVWKSISENNCSHYTLLQSEDGDTWNTIGTISGSGNSSIPIQYHLPHHNVLPIVNYYKLKQYDFNGDFTTFGPISIDNTVTEKQVIKYVNLMGQEIDYETTKVIGVYIEIYSDGTMRKIIK